MNKNPEEFCRKRAAAIYKEAYPGEGRRDDKGKAIKPPKTTKPPKDKKS